MLGRSSCPLRPGMWPTARGDGDVPPASGRAEDDDQSFNVSAQVGPATQKASQHASEGLALRVAALLGGLVHEFSAFVQFVVRLQQVRACR